MRTLNAGVRISVVSANCATFHCLASLEATHVITLDAVGAVWVLVFVIATTFARVVHTV
jgi:hypothetical protein